jgi:hypothetical protein
MPEPGSRFSIRFREISGLVPPECWAMSAGAAKRIALDALNSGAAKRAEIRDQSGNLILELPEDVPVEPSPAS